MKYIIVKVRGSEQAIVFGDVLSHADVAKPYLQCRRDIVAAGFCSISWDREGEFLQTSAYGESESIKQAFSGEVPHTAREEDADLIRITLDLNR